MLLAFLPLAVAAQGSQPLGPAQPPSIPLGPLPASARQLREDLASVLGYVSSAATPRLLEVERARQDLERAHLGLDVTLELEPELEYELDLTDMTPSSSVGLAAVLGAGVAHDEDLVLRARAALLTAQARYRTQLRSVARAALLDLSDERLAREDLAEAEAEADAARQVLAAALASGAAAEEVARLELDVSLADVALERERLAYADHLAVLDRLAARPAGTLAPVEVAGLLAGPVPAQVVRSAVHADVALLRVAVERAELALRNQPFETVREVELTGSYESGGGTFGVELGLRRGVPTADAELGWDSGDSGNAISFGVSATLVFSADSPSRTTLAQEERDRTWRELAALEATLPTREQAASALLELAYEELRLLLMRSDDAAAELAAARASGEDVSRPERTAIRAAEAAERAWQRYVRALFDYLDVIDAVLAPPGAATGD